MVGEDKKFRQGLAARHMQIDYHMIALLRPSSQFWNYVKSSNGLEIMPENMLPKREKCVVYSGVAS